MMKIKRLAALLAAVMLCAGILPLSVSAENTLPSIIVNEESWYKDILSPLIERDGRYYVPAEVFTMLGYIEMSIPADDNLLLTNRDSGAYLSILFMERAAAVNGKIMENIGVFRDSGVYYVEAAFAASALGVNTEVYSENGVKLLRVYDGERIFTLDEVVAAYSKNNLDEFDSGAGLWGDMSEDEYNGMIKCIYILCATPENSYSEFRASDILDKYGLDYTLFLNGDESSERIISAASMGEYGIDPDGAESEDDTSELDAANGKISEITLRTTHLTLTTGSQERDAELMKNGYCPINPDFTVNGASYPDGMLADIMNALAKQNSVTVFLKDCWNSERMIILLSEFAGVTDVVKEYRILNFAYK